MKTSTIIRARALLALLTVLTIYTSISVAQQAPSMATLNHYGIYDTDRLPPAFHAGRRALLLSKMPEHSAALFLAAPERVRANDVNYIYHQDPNFYYLTGCTEPESALILSKDPLTLPDGSKANEVIFVRNRDAVREVWNGYRLGPEGAKSILGFSEAFAIDTLRSFLRQVLPTTKTLYYRSNTEAASTEPVLDTVLPVWNATLAAIKTKYPQLEIGSLVPVLAEMRSVKQPEELALMKKCIAISNDAHNQIMRSVRPGWHEYEMQALGEYIFTKNGAEYDGYPCIVGSGENSTILHYETNRRQTKSGDFIEMDMGAEYHGYSADITRSFPVNGKFTPEQRAIYDLVLEAQDSGIKAAQVGNQFRATHFAAVSVIQRGLVRLGILKDPNDYKKYFMHGTSHYLGLDVHDAGLYGSLVSGNVITVEPGIYIKAGSDCDPKWWNIGCRIEDNILITDQGPVNLSAASPRTAADVEKLMSKD